MSNVAIVTDSNSGITQAAGKELGISRSTFTRRAEEWASDRKLIKQTITHK